MRKIQKLLTGVFCFGVFLTGIGAGLTFIDVSSFQYTGETIVGETSLITDTFDFSISQAGGKAVEVYYNPLTFSDDVPEGIVRFKITYNADAVEPNIYFNDDGDTPYVMLRYHSARDEFAEFMEHKDEVLKQFKNHQIGSFRTLTVEKEEVLVNPASADMVIAK